MDPNSQPSQPKFRFTVGSLIALMLVVAFCLVSLGYLVVGQDQALKGVFWFSPYTSMMPMAMMIIVSWCVFAYRWFVKLQRRIRMYSPAQTEEPFDLDSAE